MPLWCIFGGRDVIYLFFFAARTEPYELWQGSGIGGPELSYSSHRT